MKLSIRVFMTVLAALLLAGCGGSGSSEERLPLDLADMAGEYKLIGILVIFDDGGMLSEQTFDSWSGTMFISADGLVRRTLVLNGYEETTEQTWKVYDPGDSYAFVREGGCAMNVGIRRTSAELVTSYYNRCGYRDETFTWQKMKD